MSEKFFIVGGAGFIGSHFVDSLLAQPSIKAVTVYDNFSSGKKWYLAPYENNEHFHLIEGNVSDYAHLRQVMVGHDTVIHLASNPDIARAANEPTIDFEQGTVLTRNVLEAMRETGTSRILYASGSGVYGDIGEICATEDFGPQQPISTYGASKLAGEALISAYAHMFNMSGLAFRFGNVVGPRQTHGVGLDFICKLRTNPDELVVLGDGKQSKSYVYVSDVVNAVLLTNEKVTDRFAAFNVATGDYVTVGEIANIAIQKVVGDLSKVKLSFTGGDRGWKGDVPVVRLDTKKIRSLGWQCNYNSLQAIERSIDDMLKGFGQTVATSNT